MSCNIQTKVIDSLRKHGVISDTSNEILNVKEFDRINKGLTSEVEDKYNISTYGKTLFEIDTTGSKPSYKLNSTLFSIFNEMYAKSTDPNLKASSFKSIPLDENAFEDENEFEDESSEKSKPVDEDENTVKTPEYYKLNTLEQKLDHIVKSMKDNLDISIKKYQNLLTRAKDDRTASIAKLYKSQLESLLSTINKYEGDKRWSAIASFSLQMEKTVSSLTTRFSGINFDSLNTGEAANTISQYEKYSQSVALIPDLKKFMVEARDKLKLDSDDSPITQEEYDTIMDTLNNALGQYDTLTTTIKSRMKDAMVAKLSNKKYATEVLSKWRKKLSKEFNNRGLKGNKTKWINEQMDTVHSAEIQDDIRDHVETIIHSPSFDISQPTKLFLSPLNTNSKLIQLFQLILTEIKDTVITLGRDFDFKMQDLSKRLIAERGNTRPSELYKNILDFDSTGKAYLKGEYKVEFIETYLRLKREYETLEEELVEKYGEGSEETDVLDDHEFMTWQRNNIQEVAIKGGTTLKPISKWLNDLSNLSSIEKEVLESFKDTTKESSKNTFGISSLIETHVGAKYYNLPSITKSDLERTLEMDAKGLWKDKKLYFTKTRADDVGYDEVYTDDAGNPIRNVKVHYRGGLDPDQQSLDLFRMMSLEYKNGINFKEKSRREGELVALVEISKNKKYNASMGGARGVISKLLKNNPRQLVDGITSQTYARMQSMLESNIYDSTHTKSKMLGLDMNKTASFLNGWTATLGMTLNEVTAVTNVLNGKTQLLLEVISGQTIKRKSVAKAEAAYMLDMRSNLKDMYSPVKNSRTNQINEMFDTFGAIASTTGESFIKNTLLKSKGNFRSLQGAQEVGEHWMQSVLTMSILDSNKVMNENYEYIDKEGKVVDKSKAASILDMLQLKNGKLEMDSKVVYTSHTPNIRYNQGGKEMIQALIKQKVLDTAGNYTEDMKADFKKLWYGKLLLMYRGYLAPGLSTRFRGISSMNKRSEDLKYEETFYSESMQQNIEGNYVTLGRYAITSLYQSLKQMSLEVAITDWKNLSSYEKSNIQKAIVELGLAKVILSAAAYLFGALDDDDDPKVYFAILQLKRLESELSAYTSVTDQYRILNSPIPSARVLESFTTTLSLMMDPLDKVKSGKNEGQYKVIRKLKSIAPLINRSDTTYKQKIEFLEYMTN